MSMVMNEESIYCVTSSFDMNTMMKMNDLIMHNLLDLHYVVTEISGNYSNLIKLHNTVRFAVDYGSITYI